MPELPEVENIRRNLEGLIYHKRVKEIRALTPEVLVNPDNLCLEGQTLESLDRKGKYLIFNFSQAQALVHLRMTGKLLVEKPQEAKEEVETGAEPGTEAGTGAKTGTGAEAETGTGVETESASGRGKGSPYLRAYINFADGSRLLFDDVRRFGRISLYPPGEITRDQGFANLGPDALSPAFSEEDFLARLRRHPRAHIKTILLNQEVVAGIGNIYADEALFRAAIRPQARVGRLSQKRLRKLHQAIRQVLEEALNMGGTSFRDYVNSFGKKGHFQYALRVYQREGQACLVCGQPIKKIVLAGRASRYCPYCQKA